MVRYTRGAFFAERMILWQEKKPAFTNVKMVAGKHAMSRRLEWTVRKGMVASGKVSKEEWEEQYKAKHISKI